MSGGQGQGGQGQGGQGQGGKRQDGQGQDGQGQRRQGQDGFSVAASAAVAPWAAQCGQSSASARGRDTSWRNSSTGRIHTFTANLV